MKFSIRSKFSVGMAFLSVILMLSIFSAYHMDKLSKETGIILKENYESVVYAQEMEGALTIINAEITISLLSKKSPDSLQIKSEIENITKSLQAEKNNITEPGEDTLVAGIEAGIKEYCDSVVRFSDSQSSVSRVLNLQKKYGALYQQLDLLSKLNGKAIEEKTKVNKISSQNALAQMSILATLCFIIALFYSYSFSSYSNDRFSQLFKGIKKIEKDNYRERLDIDGTDEIYEISLIFNNMVEKLNENDKKMVVPLLHDPENVIYSKDLQELKNVLVRIKVIEGQANDLISKLEGNRTT